MAEPDVIHAVVMQICSIERQAGLDRTIAIGKLVLSRFFGGSVHVWRDRRKNKNNSVRRLAQHPFCPLSRSALNQAIAISVAADALPCVQTFGHIGSSHIAAVLNLDVPAQQAWLERADGARWSVRELKERITLQRRQTGERRGRPKGSLGAQALSKLEQCVRRLERTIEDLRSEGLSLEDGATVKALAVRLRNIQSELRDVSLRPLHSAPRVDRLDQVKASYHAG